MSEHPLTPEQRAAVAARDRDVFLEAGAGTGKTRVLVERYCEAVSTDGVDVEAILAFTFTERAAAELRERVRRRLGDLAARAEEGGDPALGHELREHARATERAWVLTIHGFCRRLLAAHPVAAGLDPRFRVLDEAEAVRLRQSAFEEALAELLESGSPDVARAAASYRQRRLAEMTIGVHERLRNQGMAEPRLPAVSEPMRTPDGDEDPEPLTPAELRAAKAARAALEELLEGFHRRYQRAKGDRAGLDFADLELRALELMRSVPAVAEAWRGRFTHVLVDEFQDTNRVQVDLVEELRGRDTRVFAVGDEHQSIYRFRNADLEVFRERRDQSADDPATERLALRGNFRSRPQVLGAVNQIGSTLLDRFDPLTWGRDADGAGSTELLLTLDEGDGEGAASWKREGIDLDPPATGSGLRVVAEARHLARRLRQLVDEGTATRGDIVVLLRAFTHVDTYEEALARAGLEPYVVGGRGYWSQQQVEDVVRLLAAVSNPLDDEYLFGALASPACGVSPDALWLLRQAAGERQAVWPVVEWRYGEDGREPTPLDAGWLEHVPDGDAERLRRFCGILVVLRAEAPRLRLEALVERALGAFDYDLALLSRPGGTGRMANVRKLMRLAREFERHEGRDLAGFLAVAASSTRRDEREGMAPVHAEQHDGVRVMTVHAAKGLEFPVVAVPDLGRGLRAGGRAGDVVIGRSLDGAGTELRFGMRLAFPSADSLGLWELTPLHREESAADAEEGCRLVYVAATRARDRLILSGHYKPAHLAAAEPKPSDSALRRLLPGLVSRGWHGTEGIVELAPPARAAGATDAEAPPVELRVELNEPRPERAAWLRETLPGPAPARSEAESGPPPLLGSLPRTVPAGHLSYSALAEYERCGYRFYVERVLGVRPTDPETTAEIDPGPSDERAPGERARAIGNAVHAALEWSARRGWAEPSERELGTLLRREGLDRDAEAEERVATAVRAWLASELRAGLEGWSLRPEVPFVLPLGGTIVRGAIDLLATGPAGERCVIDFKTDALGQDPPALVGERYAVQRAIYALAAAPDPEGTLRAVHLFLERPDEPVVQQFGPAELALARTALEDLVGRIRDGEFEVTRAPDVSICFGCPAAARLCPRPAWKPQWARVAAAA